MKKMRNPRWEKMTAEERAAEKAEWEATSKELEERIAYHRARLAEQDRRAAEGNVFRRWRNRLLRRVPAELS
jgi:hypothetical protein